MKKEFRLKKRGPFANPLIEYTFDTDKTMLFQALKGLPDSLKSKHVNTEADLARAWADFAKMSIEHKDYGESKVPIWHGHYEQFGRVMLEIVRFVVNRDQYKDRGFYNLIPKLEDISFLGEPSGTEDRTFYRIWFEFLGHPEFRRTHIKCMEPTAYAYWGLIMTWAFSAMKNELFKQ